MKSNELIFKYFRIVEYTREFTKTNKGSCIGTWINSTYKIQACETKQQVLLGDWFELFPFYDSIIEAEIGVVDYKDAQKGVLAYTITMKVVKKNIT